MRRKYPAIFFLLLSFYICIVSLQLGLGAFRSPGPGFLSFWSGIILGILTLIMLIQQIWFNKANTAEEKKDEIHWKAFIPALVALFITILIFERLGFVISTTLFVGFLLKCIEKKGWLITIFVSLGLTLASYYIFKVLLYGQPPKGIFGF